MVQRRKFRQNEPQTQIQMTLQNVIYTEAVGLCAPSLGHYRISANELVIPLLPTLPASQ